LHQYLHSKYVLSVLELREKDAVTLYRMVLLSSRRYTMSNVILRLPTVKTRTGLSRSTIYLRVAAGNFPKPISLGARAVGWLDSEIDAWLANQIELSRRTQGCRSGVLEVR
jgi:prophage regulatory protein